MGVWTDRRTKTALHRRLPVVNWVDDAVPCGKVHYFQCTPCIALYSTVTMRCTENVALHHMMAVHHLHPKPLAAMPTTSPNPLPWNIFHSNRTSSGLASSSALPQEKMRGWARRPHAVQVHSSVHILLPPSTCLHPSLLLKSMIGQKSTNQGRENSPEEPCSATLNTIPCRITSFHLHSPAICMCFALQSGLCNVHCKAGEYEQSAHPQYLTYRVAGRAFQHTTAQCVHWAVVLSCRQNSPVVTTGEYSIPL